MPQLVLKTESVDYGGGRGAQTIRTTVNVSVNNSTLSFSHGGTSGSTYWGLCGTTTAYRICVDAQYKIGSGSWSTIAHNEMAVAICPSLTNVVSVVGGLVNGLPSVTVSGNGSLRMIYYANRNPAPSADLPNAFPNSSYAEASQTPITVDVYWTASLAYNANGGSSAPATQSQGGLSQSTADYTFTVSASEPTRTGYRFDGWAESAAAATPTIFAGDSITVTKDSPSKTLYAVWTRVYTYTLEYNANGGTGAPASETQTDTATSYTFLLSLQTPTLADHSFDGWLYDGVVYQPGDSLTLTSAAPTAVLVAQWLDSYHPGQRKISGTWSSLNRTGGLCRRKVNGSYDDLRTIDGGTGTGDPPSRKTSGTWYNQRKCGQE